MPEPLVTVDVVAAFLHLVARLRLGTLVSKRAIDWLLATIAVAATIASALIDWV
jgi:L-cystine uptake protein TcyP (sodium:dicarboxylate symporter family)